MLYKVSSYRFTNSILTSYLKREPFHEILVPCADLESLSEGSNYVTTSFLSFLVDERRGIQIPIQAGHDRPASETPFKWRFDDVPMMSQN